MNLILLLYTTNFESIMLKWIEESNLKLIEKVGVAPRGDIPILGGLGKQCGIKSNTLYANTGYSCCAEVNDLYHELVETSVF